MSLPGCPVMKSIEADLRVPGSRDQFPFPLASSAPPVVSSSVCSVINIQCLQENLIVPVVYQKNLSSQNAYFLMRFCL